MVGVFMVQSMAIHPGDRIYIDPEDVIHDCNSLHEPFSVVERAMSDSQMKNIRQIQPAKKPTENKISSADQHSHPGPRTSWGGIHTSQHVGKDNQIAQNVVGFHDDSCGLIVEYSNRNQTSFQIAT